MLPVQPADPGARGGVEGVIAYLRGRLVETRPGQAVVEVGGVGLEVRVPAGTLSALPPVGDPVTLYTQLVVREDEMSLYGFASDGERELFRTLQGVSGIGPRLALAIVSACPPPRFWQAVRRQDASLLAGIPGVGRKTIGRLLVELRDRPPARLAGEEAAAARPLEAEGVRTPVPEGVGTTGQAAGVSLARDQARDALAALGYSHREAVEAVSAALAELGEDLPADQIIAAALRWLGRQISETHPVRE